MISIVIPTYNAIGNIENSINTLKAQAVDDSIEIVVIDSSSTDGTSEYCESCSNIQFVKIEKSEFNHGHTRNLAASKASGEILVFMTQDALPYDEFFIQNLVRPIRENRAVACYGRQIARPDALPKEKLTRDFNYPNYNIIKNKNVISHLGIKTFFFTNVCSAVQRRAFDDVFGFPEHTILNEDMLLSYKLIMNNKTVMYISDAKVVHSHNYNFTQQFKRNFDIAVSLKMEEHILQYANAESEGATYVKYVLKNLLNDKQFLESFSFIWQCVAKLVGYKLGLKYPKIPNRLRKKFSMNPSFWDQDD